MCIKTNTNSIMSLDGTENLKGHIHRLHLDVTEVGREKSASPNGQYLQVCVYI